MDELEFSNEDIRKLADTLNRIELSGPERKLLVAIFAAAANRATPVGPGGKAKLPGFEFRDAPRQAEPSEEVTFGDLKEQLLNAFIPGQDFTFVVRGKIVGEPKIIGPPPGNRGDDE